MAPPKVAICKPEVRPIMGRRPMYPRAESLFTSARKAVIHGPKVRLIMGGGGHFPAGRKPVHITAADPYMLP